MNLKGILGLSTGLMVVCAGLIPSFAHAEDYVTQSQVNAANGVAGLNENKQVTADVKNANIEASHIKMTDQYILTKDISRTDENTQKVSVFQKGSAVTLPLVKLIPDELSSSTLGSEVVQFGGDYARTPDGELAEFDNPQDPIAKKISVAIPRSLSIIGRPYSNYNAGCTLCVFSTKDGMFEGGTQAALSGSDPALEGNPGVVSVVNSDFVTAGFYQYDENSPARVAAQAASFDAHNVYLSSPMTDAQMMLLKKRMYITTNVSDIPNSTGTQKVNGNLAVPRVYWGYIKSWDANHIEVYNWAVPGIGECAPKGPTDCTTGQVPNINNIDKTLSSYDVPMIFVGVPDKLFSKNTMMFANGAYVLGDKATAVANQFEREEFDFRGRNWTKPNSFSYHGWTTSFVCDENCDPDAVSEDSYAYLVNGASKLPRAYIAQMDGDALEFSGYSTMLPGNGAPHHVDESGKVSDAIVGSNHIMSSFESGISNNKVHMSSIINRDVIADNDWHDYSVRLVMDVDGNRDRRSGLTGGVRMGSIAFNYNAAHQGGICLLGDDTNQGLCQEADGSVNFANDISLNSDTYVGSGKKIYFRNDNTAQAVYLLTQQNYTDADKAAGKPDTRGDIYIGTNVAGGANIRGVNGYYGQSLMLSGEADVGGSVNITGAANLNGNTAFNGVTVFNQNSTINSGRMLTFRSDNNPNAFYLTTQYSYTDADKAAGKQDTRGDLFVGTQVAGGGNIRGVNGYYGQSATVSGQVAAASFKGQLSTPASSSASCNAGEFKDDVNYHYVCVAQNKWKRVALSDF